MQAWFRTLPFIRSGLCLSLCIVNIAQAEAIEEIVVRAEFRDTGSYGIPASLSVVEPDRAGTVVHHLEEILGRVPNVNYSSGASRGRFIQVRGIGERSQFAETLNPSVGLLLDGVDLSGIGTVATLFDVAQVEVLRGPQGTLYGANALAGLVNVVTPMPTETFSGKARLESGNYGALGMGAAISNTTDGGIGYRLSVQRYRDDGFVDNEFLDRDDTNDHDELTLRAKFTWQVGGSAWMLDAGYVDVDNGYDAFSLDNDRNTLSDEPGQDRQQTFYAALNAMWGLDGYDLEITATIADSDMDYGYDEDWTFTGFHPFGYTSTDRYERDRQTATLDVRWRSSLEATPWQWTVGMFGLDQHVDLDRTYTFAAPFSNEFDVERIAAYGEITRLLGADWQVTLGARVERHRSDYADTNGVAFDPEDDLFGARFRIQRNVAGGLVYASLAQGYKSGGFNQDGTLDRERRDFADETLWNFEIGYKARLLQDRLGVQLALFRMERDDIQLSKFDVRPIPGGAGAVEFIEYIDNASDGFNQGLEFELDYLATDRLRLFLNLGLLDTEYNDDESGRGLGGRSQAHAPKYQYFAGLDFDIGGGWSVQIESEGKDDFFHSVTHDAQSESFELWHAGITFEYERWRVRAWGRNLTDKDYQVRGFVFGNDPRDLYTSRPFIQLGSPRQYGISLDVVW